MDRNGKCDTFLDFEDLDMTYGERLLMRCVGPGAEAEVLFLGEEAWWNDSSGQKHMIGPPTAREWCRRPIEGMQAMRIPAIARGALLLEFDGTVHNFPWEDIIFVQRVAERQAA